MFRPDLVGTAWRMQRIAEEHQARDAFLTCRRDLGGDASAHRLAADDELPAIGVIKKFSATGRPDDGPIAAFELVVPVGHSPALLCIDKIEPHDVDAAPREPSGKTD